MYSDVKKALCEAYHRLAASKEGSYGTPLVTAKLPQGGMAVASCTVPASDVTEADILILDAAGQIAEGVGTPDPRVAMHRALYAACDGMGAIAQSGSRWSSIWAQSGKMLPPVSFLHAENFFGEIPCTGPVTFGPGEDMYEVMGTLAVSALARKGVHATSALFLRGDSGVVCDPTVEGAIDRALVLEELCLRAFYSSVLDGGCHGYMAVEIAEQYKGD